MSTDNKSLKFIHLGSTAAATDKVYDAGSIIFEPKSGRIAVSGAKGLEYYGGGRIADATFKDRILTISFNDSDETIKLDFSDTASASGVQAVLEPLANRVKTLEATVNGAEGVAGLVTKVQTNTDNISQNTAGIAANTAAIGAINDESTGILAQAKTYTNTEVGKLKTTVDSNSGKITALEGLHADKDASSKKTVKEEIDAKVGWVDDKTVKKYVDDAVKTVTDDATDLSGRVTTLETTVGDASKGLVKDVADLKGLHAAGDHNGMATVAEEVAAGIATVVAQAPADFDTLKEIADWIANDTTGAAKMANDIQKLNGSVGTSSDPASETGTVYARIAKNVADISNLKSRHNGDLTVKEEVAKGIDDLGVTSVASDDKGDVVVTVTTTKGKVSGVAVDTKGITDKVTANTNKITALEGAVGKPAAGSDAATGLYKDIADNKAAIANNASAISTNTTSINGHTTDITALKGLHGKNADKSLMTVEKEADARIAAIAEASKNDSDHGVSVTVVTKSGSVSGVTVDASTLATRVGTLETTVGDASKGLVNTVNTHTKDITNIKTNLGDPGADAGTGTAFARIKALETAQSSGSLTWFDWQN